jgi:chromosome segregation ATPase
VAEESSEEVQDTGNEVKESDDPIENLTEDIGDDWTPKAANRFKELKTELKTNRSELDQLRQQSKEYESKIQELTGLAENKDVEQLQERLAQYEQQQALSNLEQTQAYQQAVSEPLEALVEQADQIADKYEVDSDALIDVLSLDDPQEQEEQLAELLPNASDRDKAKIYRIMEDIDPIIQRREQLYENADAALAEAKQLEEQQQAAVAAEQAQLRQNITKNVVERVQQKLPFLKGIEGLDMSAIQQKASETDPTVLHPVDHAYNAVSAQVFPTVVRQYLEMRKEVEALTDRLAEYEDAEPAMSGQTKAPAAGAGAGLPDDASFEERVNAALGAV